MVLFTNRCIPSNMYICHFERYSNTTIVLSFLGMCHNFEFADKYTPWNVTSLDDFLFYCCPECENRTVTKGDFIQHAVNHHPRSQNIIDSLEANYSQEFLTKFVNESENNLNDENQAIQSIESDALNSDDFSEKMEIEETKPELTTYSGLVTKVNHEIIKGESSDNNGETSIPALKEAVLSLPKLSDKIITKYYTKDTEFSKSFNDKSFACKTNLIKTEVTSDGSSDSDPDDNESGQPQPMTSSSNEDNLLGPPLLDQNDFLKPTLVLTFEQNSSDNCRFEFMSNSDPLSSSYQQKDIENTKEKQHETMTNIEKEVHKNRQHTCDKCHKSFFWKKDLYRHIRSIHENIRFNCHICGKSFYDKSTLNRHIQSLHEHIRYKCDKCDKSYAWKSELNRHKCGNSFSHIQSVHENVLQYNCDMCNKSFQEKGALKKHIQGVHEKVRYSCDKCDKSYSHKDSLNTHIQSVHENVQHECDKCDKIFPLKESLRAHIRSVHENVRYNCDMCDKSFSRKGHLNRHIESAHKNVRYNCDECDKSYPWKTELAQHMKNIHQNVRYNCSKCDKSFSQKGTLKIHIQSVHENVRFNCDQCDKSFSWKALLNAHIKSVHEKVKYKCDYCEETFQDGKDLDTHIKVVHEGFQFL